MDPKMYDLNTLRVLNDAINQTIDVLVRAQRFGATALGAGFSHSPYMASSIFGTPAVGLGLEYGLGHTAYNPYAQFAPYAVSPFAGAIAGGYVPSISPVVDPFFAQRGLAHTAAWQPWSPIEIARQSQLTQAIAARNAVLESVCRSLNIPV